MYLLRIVKSTRSIIYNQSWLDIPISSSAKSKHDKYEGGTGRQYGHVFALPQLATVHTINHAPMPNSDDRLVLPMLIAVIPLDTSH